MEKYPRFLHEFEGYKLGKTIDKGSMGKVKIATTSDGVQYACKIIKRPVVDSGEEYLKKYTFMEDLRDKYSNTTDDMDDIRLVREMATTLLLDHPYIVTVHAAFVSNYYYYVLMDFVNGTQVLDFIISHGKLKEKFAQNLFAQLVSAVEYCHLNSIVHRDLKIENILINNKGFIQLIDFGLANLFSYRTCLSTFCGSLYFAAPELLAGKKYIGPEGVILYVLTCGKVPFDDCSLPALNAKIKAGVVEYPSHLSSCIKDLLSTMLVVNPLKRATLNQVKSHIWFTKGSNFPNFVPVRKPITTINLNVVSHMGGFRFGTVDQIVAKIQIALKTETPEEEPILNIYHLVQEKLERSECVYRETNIVKDGLQLSPKEKIKRTGISLPLRRTKSFSSKTNKKNGFKFDLYKEIKRNTYNENHNVRRDTVIENIKSQIKKLKPTGKEDEESMLIGSDETEERDPDVEDKKKLKSFTKVISGFFAPKTVKASSKDEPDEIIKEPIPSDSIKIMNSKSFLASPSNSKSLVEPLGYSISIPHTRSVSSRKRHSLASRIHTLENFYKSDSEYQTWNTSIKPASFPGLITDRIDKVSFAGIFSVSTTSTRHPLQIRDSIIAALKILRREISLSYYERKGVIVVLIKNNMPSDQSSSDASISSISASSLARRTSIAISTTTSNGSLVENNITSDGDPSVLSKRIDCKSSFEICIGKLPMLKLHCIKFHKLEGNSIRYKQVCSRFLEILSW